MLWIGIVFDADPDPDPDSIQVLHMLENPIFFSFIQVAVPGYIVLSFSSAS
jgi:hypothetical protein